MIEKERGKVKFFNDEKGYGFLTPDNGGPDVFIHYSNIKAGGFKKLETGQAVTYVLGEGKKGLEARDVEAL